MLQISITTYGDQPTQDYPLSAASISIGRNEENEICLHSGIISGVHAKIFRKCDGLLVIEDCDSINGTFVNGKQIDKSAIKAGDSVRFGDIDAEVIESGVLGIQPSAVSALPQATGSVSESSTASTDHAELAATAPEAEPSKDPSDLDPAASEQDDDKITGEFESLRHGILEANPDVSEIETPSDLADSLFAQLQKSRYKASQRGDDIKRLRKKVDTVTAERDRHARDNAQKKELLESLQNQVLAAKGKEKSENNLRIQLAELKRLRDQSNARLEQQDEEIKNLEERLADVSGDGSQLQETLERLHGEIAQLNEQRAKNLAELAAARGQVEGAQAEIKSLQSCVSDLEGDEDSQQKRIAELSELNQQQATDIGERDATIAERSDEIKVLRKQFDELEKSSSGAVGTMRLLEKEREELRVEVEKRSGELAASQERESQQREQLGTHEAQLSERKRSISELSAQVQAKDTKLAEAAAVEKKLNERAATLQASIDDLQLKLAESTSETEALGQRAAAAETGAEAMLIELEELRGVCSDVAAAESRLEEVKAEIEAHEPERKKLDRALVKHRAANEAAKAEVEKEHAAVYAAMNESRKQLESIDESVQQARQQAQAQADQIGEACKQLEQRRRTDEVELSLVEARRETTEEKLKQTELAVRELEAKRTAAEAEVGKQRKSLDGIKRKIGRRKKLLLRLKAVGRRERELERKLAEAQQTLAAAEAHKPGKKVASGPQPWDVDQAVEQSEKAVQQASLQAQSIAGKLEAAEAELEAKRGELLRLAEQISHGEVLERELAERQGELAGVVERCETANKAVGLLEAERDKLVAAVVKLRGEAEDSADSSKASGAIMPQLFGADTPA